MLGSSRTPLLHDMPVTSEACQADRTLDIVSGLATSGLPSPACTYYETAHPAKGYVKTSDDLDIYYEVHGLEPGMSLEQAAHRPKVLMIMGLACSCSAWRWQLQDLVQQHKMKPDFIGDPQQQPQQQQQQQPQQQPSQHQQQQPHSSLQMPRLSDPDAQQHWQQEHALLQRVAGPQQGMLVCIMDNRGVGNSSSPVSKQAYSTQLMTRDALAVMDQLCWDQAHLLGFSMGGMVCQSLAVLAPHRVQSLTLLSTSCGGMQIVPHSWSGLKVALKMVMARTPEDAVDATLRMHYRRRTLKTWVTHHAARRQELLRREYMTPTGCPAQPPHGFKGQLHACWTHRLSQADARAIVQAGFPVLVIHGRNDKLASAANAEALARRLNAPCVILPGAHFIVRECAGQINMLLSSLVLGPMHIHGVANSHYLDPSPAIQQAWSEAPRKHSAIVEASSSSRGRTVVYATINSSVEFDLGKLK